MIRITQQRNKCIGCNACVEASHSRWRMSRKDGKSVLIGGVLNNQVYTIVVGDDEYLQGQMAARNCPVNIIKIKKI